MQLNKMTDDMKKMGIMPQTKLTARKRNPTQVNKMMDDMKKMGIKPPY